MQLIELECPSCDAPLSVDAGFAGGVCRCSNCGSLMTVPADPSIEAPERLSRPDSPDGSGMQHVADHNLDPAAAMAAAASTGVEHYTTESGKAVAVSKRQRIPTAQKRKIARRVTYAVFAVIFLFLIAIGGIAGYLLIQAMSDTTEVMEEQPIIIEEQPVLIFDEQANPYFIKLPNVMGMPVAESSIVIIDASAESSDWLESIARLVAAGGRSMAKEQKFQVLLVGSGGIDAIPHSMDDWAFNHSASLIERATSLSPVGKVDLVQAIDKATRDGAKQITIIAARASVDGENNEAVLNAIQSLSGVELNLFIINDESQPIFDAAESTGGRGMMLLTRRINTWQRQAEEHGLTGN